jgi:hypothetical protein
LCKKDIVEAVRNNTLKLGTRCKCCNCYFAITFFTSSHTEHSVLIERSENEHYKVHFKFYVVKTDETGDHHFVTFTLQNAKPKPTLITYNQSLVIPLQDTTKNAVVSVLTANGVEHDVLSADYLDFLK